MAPQLESHRGATAPILNLSQNGYGDVGDVISVRVTPSDGTVSGTAFIGNTTLVGSPAATFVIGTDHLIYELKLDNLGNPTGGYILVSSLQARSVAVGQDALGRTELFVLGTRSVPTTMGRRLVGAPTKNTTIIRARGRHPRAFPIPWEQCE